MAVFNASDVVDEGDISATGRPPTASCIVTPIEVTGDFLKEGVISGFGPPDGVETPKSGANVTRTPREQNDEELFLPCGLTADELDELMEELT